MKYIIVIEHTFKDMNSVINVMDTVFNTYNRALQRVNLYHKAQSDSKNLTKITDRLFTDEINNISYLIKEMKEDVE